MYYTGILKRPGDAVEPQTPVKTPKLDAKSTPTPSRSVPSPWGSVSKYSSQASSLLKELEESQQLLMTSMNESSSDSDSVVESSQLSVQQSSQVSAFSAQSVQPPHTVLTGDQRSRLEQLQLLRNVGVWVHCCRMSCNKLRYLANITDPQDVPDIWYCHMNPVPPRDVNGVLELIICYTQITSWKAQLFGLTVSADARMRDTAV
ncbi:Zinc finger CW-type PWWP domain protein 1 [Homalodisca vitripennis]|nr:Zinc finger CW-type PWWP domain protein 1 [Homalodisca vitripennis]